MTPIKSTASSSRMTPIAIDLAHPLRKLAGQERLPSQKAALQGIPHLCEGRNSAFNAIMAQTPLSARQDNAALKSCTRAIDRACNHNSQDIACFSGTGFPSCLRAVVVDKCFVHQITHASLQKFDGITLMSVVINFRRRAGVPAFNWTSHRQRRP